MEGTRTVSHRATEAAGKLVTGLFAELREELVRYLAFRVHDRVLVDDLEQEVYLRLLRLDQVHLIRNARAYVFRVAASVVADHGRRHDGPTLDESPGGDGPVEHGVGPFEEFLWRQRLELVQRVVAQLPERCRRALILHRRDGWTYDEIAHELGVSKSMVKKYLKKALVLCRRALAHEDDRGDALEHLR
jgi:RNA polymerase sigma factor (sigma-70 family)